MHKNSEHNFPMEEWLSCRKRQCAKTTLALQVLLAKPSCHWQWLLVSPMLLFLSVMGLGNLCVAGKVSGPLSLWLFGRWPCSDHMENSANQVPFLCSVAAARISSKWFPVNGGSCESLSPDPPEGEGPKFVPERSSLLLLWEFCSLWRT